MNGKSSEELDRYIADIKNCKIATKERQKELADIMNNASDEKARYDAMNELIKSNLPLVIDIVMKRTQNYYGTFTAMDFIGLGNLALCRAIKNYNGNHANGASFTSFAFTVVNNAITNAMCQDRFIKIPNHYYGIMGDIKRVENKMGKEMLDKDLAQHLSIKASRIKHVKEVFEIYVKHLETFNDINKDGGGIKGWEEKFGEENKVLKHKLLRAELEEYIQKLSPRSQEIIRDLYFEKELSIVDLAKRYKVSKQLISLNAIKALRQLRRFIVNKFNKRKNSKIHVLDAGIVESIKHRMPRQELTKKLEEEEKKNRSEYKNILAEYLKELE